MRTSLLLILLSACILEVPLGPDVGDCAEPPEGSYTFGEIGIGTCLAGPVGLEFMEREDGTWLAVSNADPYRTFTSGSVLFLNWDDFAEAPTDTLISDLSAGAVSTDPFMGFVAVADEQVLVPSRYSPDSRTVAARDQVWVIDASDPLEPSVAQRVEVRQDPLPIAWDPNFERAYVVNITGQSVSVLDTSGEDVEVLEVDSALDECLRRGASSGVRRKPRPRGVEVDVARVRDAGGLEHLAHARVIPRVRLRV